MMVVANVYDDDDKLVLEWIERFTRRGYEWKVGDDCHQMFARFLVRATSMIMTKEMIYITRFYWSPTWCNSICLVFGDGPHDQVLQGCEFVQDDGSDGDCE